MTTPKTNPSEHYKHLERKNKEKENFARNAIGKLSRIAGIFRHLNVLVG
jgi:hypothetical protein